MRGGGYKSWPPVFVEGKIKSWQQEDSHGSSPVSFCGLGLMHEVPQRERDT